MTLSTGLSQISIDHWDYQDCVIGPTFSREKKNRCIQATAVAWRMDFIQPAAINFLKIVAPQPSVLVQRHSQEDREYNIGRNQ